MTTFTTVSRGQVTWQGPAPSRSGEAYNLLISDTYKLNVGSGFNLVITPAYAPVSWTNTARQRQAWVAPTVTGSDLLDIGSGYGLNVGNGYRLIIDPNSGGNSVWTNLPKS